MYVIERNVSEQKGMMRTGVHSSPFDEHLKYFDPATAIPLRVFFFEDVDCAT
jgi:hypothetical protein